MNFIKKLTRVLILTIIMTACGDDAVRKNIPDVSNISVKLTIHRFDQALMAIDTNNTEGGVQNLENQYPQFSRLFFGPIMDDAEKPDFHPQIRAFLTDPEVRRVFDTCQMTYRDFTRWEKELTQGFQFYKHYFPEAQIPTLYTFFSMYRYGITPPDSGAMGIGLDFFLGEKHFAYNFIENLRFNYIKRTLTPEHLTKNVFEALIVDKLGAPRGNRLLDLMIHNGKQLYLLDCLLPNMPDSIKLAYTDAQTKWVYQNEAQMWAHFLKENLLYSTELEKIAKLVNPSPNASGMPPEAPGRTANFVGMRIIQQYMKRHPETSLPQLIQLRDAQKILDESKYKPARR